MSILGSEEPFHSSRGGDEMTLNVYVASGRVFFIVISCLQTENVFRLKGFEPTTCSLRMSGSAFFKFLSLHLPLGKNTDILFCLLL